MGGGGTFPGGMILGTQPIASHTAAEVSVPHDLPGQVGLCVGLIAFASQIH
jgi:hypothetical protein